MTRGRPIADIHLPQPHPAQRTILTANARYRIVACGRRFGKTEVGKMAILAHALDGNVCWWLAPTYQMTNDVWRDLRRLVRGLQGVAINQTERRIVFLRSGGEIAVRSTHLPDNLRGAGLDFVVLDEAAFMEPDVWREVVRPMLLERRGSALFLSTPYGRNWFWEIYQMGIDPETQGWEAFHFTSADNPAVDPRELAEIRRSTPERIFQAEYLAEFNDDVGQVFRGISAALTAPADEQPIPGRGYVMGIDWGRDQDYTAAVVIDSESKQMVALERFNGIGWHLQRGRLRTLADRWQPAVIWAEANSVGSVNIEALQQEGLPVRGFTTTARSKAPLIEGLALAIERGEIGLIPDPVLVGELSSYTLERLVGGGYRYAAPAGGHDDTVIATALAWYGISAGAVEIAWG